jgi:catechol 2,3-dioxygenase-like lactoylglutathione lyase family enzyme
MELGPFSISLRVKDIGKSLSFYELLGFKILDGGHVHQGYPDTEHTKWRILEHEGVKIGLFQGMFDQNIMTFNPTDVRGIQKILKAAGVKLSLEADETTTGPAYITLEDPDGNQIMFDQF